MSEENTLDYAVQPWGMQLAVGVKLACELCEIVTVTPYRFNPKSLQFEKSGDTTIDNSAYAKANHETITNYHLLRWPTWGPWRLYHQAPHICYLGAVSHHGAAVGFEVSPSQLAISVDNDIVHYQPDLEFFLHGGQLPSGLTAYIVPNPKPAGAFSGDLAPKIKFSNVVLSPLGRLTGLMPYYPPADAAEPPELTGLYRAMKLAAWYLIIDLDWNYETGAEYTHLIGMDISGSASALRQLRFCVANQ